ncbi:hypothetical protein BSNK01_21830 [Bacillaceae bacterium]
MKAKRNEVSVRTRIIRERYGREPLKAKTVYKMFAKAVSRRQGVSLIRLGDVMAKLLSKRDLSSLRDVSSFLGIPFPPPRKLLRDLEDAVQNATVVGVTHFPRRIRQIRHFMQKKNWQPPFLTDSFINDQLYDGGYLHKLIRRHRVALIGRSAPAAARRLRENHLRIPLAITLRNAAQIDTVLGILERRQEKWDLAMVGASVPGRILCVRIARTLNKPALDIGHMLDAFADPGDWQNHHNRKRYKLRWMRILRRR